MTDPNLLEYDVGFDPTGRTTPTATRLEGLQAALNYVPADLEIRDRIEAAVPRWLELLPCSPTHDAGEFDGAFPRATRPLDPKMPGANRFNQRAPEACIDYMQHSLSALLAYDIYDNPS